MLEFRTAPQGQLADIDEVKRQVLVRFPIDVRDTYNTTFGADCFRDSFERRKPIIAWQHELREPIGHTLSAQVTKDANELVGQLSDFDAVPLARRAFVQMREGTLTDASFGFQRLADEDHPELRGVKRITKATMHEWSPVSVGSIPGANITGTRSEGGIEVPSVEEIDRLLSLGVIDRGEARGLVAQLPAFREHLTIRAPQPAPVSDGDSSPGDPGYDDDDDAADLAAAVDAALDEAATWIGQVDVDSLPDPLKQALALVQAAGVAADQLLDVLGVDDPDDDSDGRSDGDGEARGEVADYQPAPYHRGPDETVTCPNCGKGDAGDARYCDQCGTELVGKTVNVEGRAPGWDPKQGDYTPAQWKAACLIDTGTGDPDNKARYKVPVKTPDGKVDPAGLDSANRMLTHVKGVPADVLAKAAKQLMSLLSTAGMKPSGSVLQAASGSSTRADSADEVEAIFARHKVA